MDVTVPPIPDTYDEYRTTLRSFLADHKPTLAWKQRTGLRVPDSAGDVELLRAYVRAIYDAGYVLARFSSEPSDPHEQRVLEQELGSTGVPHVLGNPLVAGALKHFGTDDQRASYLPPMARGDHIWTQLFSEPDAGSDLTSLQTRAQRDGDAYVVVGQKVWSTWAQWSDFGYLLARTEPVDGPAGISAFILDMRSPGVDVRPLREMTGTTDFNEVFFDEVRIPVVNMIGGPGEGWRVAGASLAEERSSVGGGGGGTDPVVRLVDVARRHSRGGRPAIDDGAVRQQIGAFAARVAYPAPPGPTRGHQGGQRRDHPGRRPVVEDLVQRVEPGDDRGGAGTPGCPLHGERGRRIVVRRWALAGRFPLRSCVDHRRRIERDHA